MNTNTNTNTITNTIIDVEVILLESYFEKSSQISSSMNDEQCTTSIQCVNGNLGQELKTLCNTILQFKLKRGSAKRECNENLKS